MQSFKKIFTTPQSSSDESKSVLSTLLNIDLTMSADALTKLLEEKNSEEIDATIEFFNENPNYLKLLQDQHLLIFLNKLSKENTNAILHLIDNLRHFYSLKDSAATASILSDINFSFKNPIINLIHTQNVYDFISIKAAYVEQGKLLPSSFIFLLQNTAKNYPLFTAAGLNDINKMDRLIKAGADVNEKRWQITVLHLALACQQKEAVEFLLKNKACFKRVSYDALPLDLLALYTGKKFLEFDEQTRPALEYVLKFFIEKTDTCVECREVLLKSIELFNINKDKQGIERYQDGFELLGKYQLIYEIYSFLQKTKIFAKLFESTEKKIQEKNVPQPEHEPLRTKALMEIKKLSSHKNNSFYLLSSRKSDNLNDFSILLAICKKIDVTNGLSLRETSDKLAELAYARECPQQMVLKP